MAWIDIDIDMTQKTFSYFIRNILYFVAFVFFWWKICDIA